ncbi:hypothetical protein F5Y13DRAFT_50460 [Hypoxylon sp. FL1857]|nr:hypothetical protein F5Y13DRAFT_50460 [Hypoxylon sp. FL1857]
MWLCTFLPAQRCARCVVTPWSPQSPNLVFGNGCSSLTILPLCSMRSLDARWHISDPTSLSGQGFSPQPHRDKRSGMAYSVPTVPANHHVGAMTFPGVFHRNLSFERSAQKSTMKEISVLQVR